MISLPTDRWGRGCSRLTEAATNEQEHGNNHHNATSDMIIIIMMIIIVIWPRTRDVPNPWGVFAKKTTTWTNKSHN